MSHNQASVHTHTDTHTHTNTHAHKRTHTHTHACMHAQTHSHTHTHAQAQTQTHTHTHTQKHTQHIHAQCTHTHIHTNNVTCGVFSQQDPYGTAGDASDADVAEYRKQKVPLLAELLDMAKSASTMVMFDVRGPVGSSPFRLNATDQVVDVLKTSGIDLSKVVFLVCFLFLRSSIGGVAYEIVFNSSASWAATFRLQGYKCMLVIFMFPSSTKLRHGLQDL